MHLVALNPQWQLRIFLSKVSFTLLAVVNAVYIIG